jgi:sensor histidine kinase YesM
MCRLEGGEVHVSISREPDRVHIEVKDNGVGMDQELIDWFYQPGSSQKGVGMANIHRRLMALYGDGLHIESAPGEGTAVYFFVPYSTDKEVLE